VTPVVDWVAWTGGDPHLVILVLGETCAPSPTGSKPGTVTCMFACRYHGVNSADRLMMSFVLSIDAGVKDTCQCYGRLPA